MNANDIKNEIRELKKEEQLQLQKLENIKKNEKKALQLSNSKIISTVNDFHLKLNELSKFYQRINMSDSNNSSSFLSEHDLTYYEQQETDISELLAKAVEKLDSHCGKNDYFSKIDNECDFKFQESLYLLHEAEMKNVALQGELASVNAQLSYLSNGSISRKQLKSNEECDREIDELTEKLSIAIKETCRNKVLLELEPDLDVNLELQMKSSQFIHQVVEQHEKQLNRQNKRIESLDRELGIHDDVGNMFESISSIAVELDRLQLQMDNMTTTINALQEPILSNDEQFLFRLKSYSDENAKEFQKIFESMDSFKKAYNQEKTGRSPTLQKLIKAFKKSFAQFDKIYENMQSFTDYVNENSYNRWNNSLTLTNKSNVDLLNSVNTKRYNERIKQLKETLEHIKVDIMIQ